MAKSGGVVVRIRLLDEFSNRMSNINKSLDAMVAKPRAIARTLSTIADKGGLNRLADQAKLAAERMSTLGQRVGNALGPLSALTSAASLAGVIVLAGHFGTLATSVAKASAETGIASGRLQELQYAAKVNNASAEALTGGMSNLASVMRDAALGQNSEALMGFNALGVSLRDSEGKLRKNADVLPELADRLAAIKDPARAAFVATTFFGGSAQELLPMLQKGSKGLQDMAADARRFGVVIGDDAVKAGVAFNVATNKSKTILQGLVDTVGGKLMPILTPIIDKFNEWVAANRELIATRIEALVGKLGEALQSVDFDKVFNGLTSFIDGIGRAVDTLGGFQNAGLVLLAFLNGPLIISAVSASSSLLGLGMSALSASVRMGLLIMPGLLTHLSGFSMVTKLAAGAQWAINAAMAANPIGAVVAAVALLAGAVYAVYQNWGKIGDWFNEKIERIKAAFSEGLIPGLWAIFKSFNPIVIVAETLDGLSKWLFDFSLFDAGKKLLGSLVDGVKALLPDFDGIIKTISGVFDWLFGSTKKATDAVAGVGKAADGAAKTTSNGATAQPTATPSPAVAQAVQQASSAPPAAQPRVEVIFDTRGLPAGLGMTTKTTGPVKASTPVGLSAMAGPVDY